MSRRDSNSSRSLYVRSMLSSLDFKSFQRIVWLWLGASGYHGIRTLNRPRRRGRGSVGPDFLVQIGEYGIEVAVQIRHWRSPLSKRAVDEMRGILLRDQIPAGMIVSSSQVSRAARLAAADFSGRPIRVVGLESLADSMIALDLGSPAFFRSIDSMSLGLAGAPSKPLPLSLPAELASNPDGPRPDRASWVLAGALLILLVLWFAKGFLE